MLVRMLRKLINLVKMLIKKWRLLRQQMVFVAEEIGGSDDDTDKAENYVAAMVEKESDCDSDEDSDGFYDMYDSDE